MPPPALPDKTNLPDLDFNVPIGCAQGVVAFSNLDDYYFSGEKCFTPEGVYAGFSRQCVCYARRHMYDNYGCIFGQCGPAHEIFDMTEVDNVVTGEKHPFVACKNCETTVKPRVGMTLVYPMCKKMPVGHVAVISAVGDDWVGIAEENQESKSWCGLPYGRVVPLVKNEETGAWSMIETDPALVNCRGWLYVEGVEQRKPFPDVTEEEMRTVNDRSLHQKIFPPLTVLPKFVAPKKQPKRMARFTAPVIAPGAPDFEKVPDERHHQVSESEDNEEVIKQLKEIQARRNAQKELRRQTIIEYEKILQERFQQEEAAGKGHHYIRPQDINNGEGHLGKLSHSKRGEITIPFARSAIPRTTHWSSVFAPSEELGITSIGYSMRAYKLLEEAMVMFCNPKFADIRTNAATASSNEDDAIARRYDMPVNALRATFAQVDKMASSPAASTALSKLDFLLGTMSLVFCKTDDHYKILHSELDSLSNLIEINAMQEYYTKVQSNIKFGWNMTTFGNDFHRALRNFQRTRYGIHEANKPIVFLDFGRAEDLTEKLGLTLPKDALYHYKIERLQASYMVEYLKEFIEDKQHDLAIGDIQNDDMVNWKVLSVNFWDEKQLKIDAESGKVFFFNGKEFEEAFVMWKMCPWSSLFAMHYCCEGQVDSAADSKLELFLNKVAYDVENPRVFQPLWTHLAGHPQFLPYLSRAAERMNHTEPGASAAVDHLRERLDGDSITKFVIPASAWSNKDEVDSHGLPKCCYKVDAFEGLVNPDPCGDQEKKYNPPISDVPHRLREPKTIHPAMHALIIGGKRSAACWIEARQLMLVEQEQQEQEECCASIWDVVLPASMTYMPSLFPRGT